MEALVQRGVQVRCLVRNKNHLGWVKDSPVEFVVGNCQERTSLKQGVKDVDQVFHLAGAITAVKEKTYFEVNALGTENLVQACIENNTRLKKFIYLSSQAAAGPCRSGGKKKESDPCEPVSPYGKSKLLGEQLALSHSHEIPLLILRPCAVYGPRDKGFYALFKWLSKGIKPCLSDHDQHISMCYVQDLVRAILLAAETQTESGEIFFLSDGQDYRMEEIGDIFAQAMEISALAAPPSQTVAVRHGLFCRMFLQSLRKAFHHEQRQGRGNDPEKLALRHYKGQGFIGFRAPDFSCPGS